MGDRASGESQAGGALYPEGVTVGEAVGWKEKSVTQQHRSRRAAGTVVWAASGRAPLVKERVPSFKFMQPRVPMACYLAQQVWA